VLYANFVVVTEHSHLQADRALARPQIQARTLISAVMLPQLEAPGWLELERMKHGNATSQITHRNLQPVQQATSMTAAKGWLAQQQLLLRVTHARSQQNGETTRMAVLATSTMEIHADQMKTTHLADLVYLQQVLIRHRPLTYSIPQ
jgi:hypothetical protein